MKGRYDDVITVYDKAMDMRKKETGKSEVHGPWLELYLDALIKKVRVLPLQKYFIKNYIYYVHF
jgi:hypothetical protein